MCLVDVAFFEFFVIQVSASPIPISNSDSHLSAKGTATTVPRHPCKARVPATQNFLSLGVHP